MSSCEKVCCLYHIPPMIAEFLLTPFLIAWPCPGLYGKSALAAEREREWSRRGKRTNSSIFVSSHSSPTLHSYRWNLHLRWSQPYHGLLQKFQKPPIPDFTISFCTACNALTCLTMVGECQLRMFRAGLSLLCWQVWGSPSSRFQDTGFIDTQVLYVTWKYMTSIILLYDLNSL